MPTGSPSTPILVALPSAASIHGRRSTHMYPRFPSIGVSFSFVLLAARFRSLSDGPNSSSFSSSEVRGELTPGARDYISGNCISHNPVRQQTLLVRV
ncbi:hypothetical protein BO71DRAFT_436229 [Aspergillus ellipticus CBS 707.79]|uniref:Uncharacterized protein n=1 Tax=Aspergillus ellipticus CBS 707.79 TaxID=1448320 RepID=A0A319CRS6_9EURO|nr:hypothetical protein BO71DRAFT_436229 [Aspergillus ellipticus CBS 707.79]